MYALWKIKKTSIPQFNIEFKFEGKKKRKRKTIVMVYLCINKYVHNSKC